jgi:hypothetical protein
MTALDSLTSASGRRGTPGGWLYLAIVGAAAFLVYLGLAAYLRSMEQRAIEGVAVHEQLTPEGSPRPLAQVAQALRELRLVTVEVDTTVTSTIGDSSWRGDVTAKVEAPVRLFYGTDLSEMSVQSLSTSPVDGAVIIRIPPPHRVATEVCTEAESINVDVGWLRLRSRAGEYFLGLARRDLHHRALALKLSPENARFVRRTTTEQVEDLARRILGERRPLSVVYQDGQP